MSKDPRTQTDLYKNNPVHKGFIDSQIHKEQLQETCEQQAEQIKKYSELEKDFWKRIGELELEIAEIKAEKDKAYNTLFRLSAMQARDRNEFEQKIGQQAEQINKLQQTLDLAITMKMEQAEQIARLEKESEQCHKQNDNLCKEHGELRAKIDHIVNQNNATTPLSRLIGVIQILKAAPPQGGDSDERR